MLHTLAAAALALSPSAQSAPTPAPATAPAIAAPLPPVDPARLAAAEPVIDQVWPLGTYARIMHGVMDQMTQGVMASMYDMRPEDFASDDNADKKADGKTLGEILNAEDPYYKQRTEITMHVMFDEIAKLMTEIEPEVRDGLAKSYARRFTVAQLSELHSFFATDTGRAYAADSMMLMMNPDMMQAMQSLAPRMVKAMPAIMAKVEAATKDLPPPPKKKAEAE